MATCPHIPVRLLALSGLLCGLVGTGVDDAQAAVISIGAFGLDAVLESFEGLAPCPNIPLLFARSVVLKHGVSGPYTFASGITLTGLLPNFAPAIAAGVGSRDFRLGPARFGLGENGLVSAVSVPDGSACLDRNAVFAQLEFVFSEDMFRVGAFVPGGSPGPITLFAYSASGSLLDRVSIGCVNVADCRNNFLGLEAALLHVHDRAQHLFPALSLIQLQKYWGNMTRWLMGVAALLCASSASAINLECYEDPRTNATQCIDAAGVKMTKDGIRYSKLYSGGPAEVRVTRFTIHTNCATSVVHLKDRQGVSFAGGYGVETKGVAALQKWICDAKVQK